MKKIILGLLGLLTSLNVWAGIGFNPTVYSVFEDQGTVTVSVEVTGLSNGETATVDYAISGGTAQPNVDFVAIPSATLTFTSNGIQTFNISIIPDFDADDGETILLTLFNCSLDGDGCLSGFDITQPSATIQILDVVLQDEPLLNRDQQEVTEELVGLCASATGELLQSCNTFLATSSSTGDFVEAVEAITPTEFSSQGEIAADFGFQQVQTIQGRISGLRTAGSGFSGNRIALAGFTLDAYGQNIPVGKIAEGILNNLLHVNETEPLRDSPLGLFIKGQFSVGEKDSTDNETGFDVLTQNITFGMDYQFTNELLAGIAMGYGHNETDFDRNSGDMEAHSANFALYGSYYLPQNFYIDWVLNYSFSEFESARRIIFSGFDNTANSTPFGQQYGGSIGFGKDFSYQSYFFSPYVRVEYYNTEIDAYSETGGGGFAVQVDQQNTQSLVTVVGGQISKSFSTNWGILTPGVRLEWLHQFQNDQREITSRFINNLSTSGFTTTTDNPDRDYFNIEASLAITLPEGKSAYLRYENRFEQDNIDNHIVEMLVRLPF